MLEHVNITVADPAASAEWLHRVFGWKIRWHGDALMGGTTFHVGDDDSYVALYRPPVPPAPGRSSYETRAALNHVGVQVDDLDETEKRVIAEGFTPENHGDYEPGRRFYFRDHDNVEWEVVSYA